MEIFRVYCEIVKMHNKKSLSRAFTCDSPFMTDHEKG